MRETNCPEAEILLASDSWWHGVKRNWNKVIEQLLHLLSLQGLTSFFELGFSRTNYSPQAKRSTHGL